MNSLIRVEKALLAGIIFWPFVFTAMAWGWGDDALVVLFTWFFGLFTIPLAIAALTRYQKQKTVNQKWTLLVGLVAALPLLKIIWATIQYFTVPFYDWGMLSSEITATFSMTSVVLGLALLLVWGVRQYGHSSSDLVHLGKSKPHSH